MIMQVIDTILEGVKIVVPKVFFDDRGYFFESFNDKEFRVKVCDTTFVQDNHVKVHFADYIGKLHRLHNLNL